MATTKIFIGNLSDDANVDELRGLFEQFGTVVECDIVKNFGFVHMEVEDEAKTAIAALNGYNLNGCKMNVELSTGKNLHGRRRTDIPSAPGGRGRGRRPDGRFMPYGRGRGFPGRGGRGGFMHGGGDDDSYASYDQEAYDELYREVYRDAYMQAYKDLCRELASREAVAEVRKAAHREPAAPSSLGGGAGGDPYRRPPPEYYDQGASARPSIPSRTEIAPVKYPGLESSYASGRPMAPVDPYGRGPPARPPMMGGRGGMPM